MHLIAELLTSAMVDWALYTYVALGFSLIFAVTGIFHFAHGGIYILGAYVTYALAGRIGLGLAVVGGVIAACLCAAAMEDGLYRPLQRRRASRFPTMIASLGAETLIFGAIGAVWGTSPVYLSTGLVSRSVRVLGIQVAAIDVVAFGSAAVCAAAFCVWLGVTRAGRGLSALAAEPEMARLVGVSERRGRMLAMVLGTAISTIGGVLLLMRSGLTPQAGADPLFIAFAAMVVGGMGNIRAALAGVALLVTLSAIAIYWVPAGWAEAFAFVIVVVVMLVRPRGLFGRPVRVTHL